MVKKALMILVAALLCLAYITADTGTIQWRYKIRKFVEENIVFTFTDNSGDAISSFEINMEKDLSYSQIHLLISTNKVNAYSVKMTFSPMAKRGETGTIGLYKARISDIVTYSSGDSDYRDIEFTSEENVVITFPGDISNSANNTVSFYYPISFDFSDYIDSYTVGSYVGTIVVEVVPE